MVIWIFSFISITFQNWIESVITNNLSEGFKSDRINLVTWYCWSYGKSKSLWVLNWNWNKLLASSIYFVFNQSLLFWNFSTGFWCGLNDFWILMMVVFSMFWVMVVMSVFSLLFNFKKVISFWNFSKNRFWEFKEISKIFRNLFSDLILSHDCQLIFIKILVESLLKGVNFLDKFISSGFINLVQGEK